MIELRSVESWRRYASLRLLAVPAAVALVIGVAVVARSETTSPCLLVLVSVLLWIALSDLRMREIPDAANLLLALAGAALWISSPHDLLWNLIVAGGATLALFFAGGVLWRQTRREWLGMGDAKLIGAGTMVVGWNALWVMLFLASVGGICAALAARRRPVEREIPFGPFLAYSILVTHLIAGPLP